MKRCSAPMIAVRTLMYWSDYSWPPKPFQKGSRSTCFSFVAAATLAISFSFHLDADSSHMYKHSSSSSTGASQNPLTRLWVYWNSQWSPFRFDFCIDMPFWLTGALVCAWCSPWPTCLSSSGRYLVLVYSPGMWYFIFSCALGPVVPVQSVDLLGNRSRRRCSASVDNLISWPRRRIARSYYCAESN